ncbi:MAG: LytTR family transcriptional regulator [Saprospiraceae bacterium]|nr:LytTR family transcriptional regulator [Saprospiraceae bacterium]
MAEFALFTKDQNVFQHLKIYHNALDFNPKDNLSNYKLICIYLDSESKLQEILDETPELNSFKQKLLGIFDGSNPSISWSLKYEFKSFINLSQFKILLESNQSKPTYDGIFLKVKNRLEKIKFSQVRWIMAKDVYSIIKTEDARYLIGHTLKEMEEKLTPYTSFKRIHRSYIVNIDFIEAIEEGELIIDSEAIPIGPAYKEDLMTRLLFM